MEEDRISMIIRSLTDEERSKYTVSEIIRMKLHDERNIERSGILLGSSHFERAVEDPMFFIEMPEFESIRSLIDLSPDNGTSKNTCSQCEKRRKMSNLTNKFLSIAFELSEERVQTLKKYIGIKEDTPLYIRRFNSKGNKLETKKM